MILSMKDIRGMAILVLGLSILISACAGGLVGSKEKKLAYFDKLERDTLARLTKDQPKAEQELQEAVGYLVAEQDAIKVPMVGWASGAGVTVEKASGKRTYLRMC